MSRPGSFSEHTKDDIEDLKSVFDVLTEFLGQLGPLIAQTMGAIIEAYPGDKIGKEVAKFYKELKEQGIPEDLAKELTKEYFESLNIMDKLGKLIKNPRLE